jgi:hypothetical protein
LVVCEQFEDESGALRSGFLGAIRYGFNGRTWSYPEADRDYIATAAIVDALKRQFIPMVVQDTKAQAVALARALITQARIAGLEPPVRTPGAEVILRGLFERIAVPLAATNEVSWDQVRAQVLQLEGAAVRPRLQSELLRRVASFQGTGAQAFAIDTPRLLDALSSDTTMDVEGLPEDLARYLPSVTDARLVRALQPVVGQLRAFQQDIAGFIDADFDKSQFVEDLRDVLVRLQEEGAWPPDFPIRLADLQARLSEFQSSAIVGLVERATIVVSEVDARETAKFLNALGALDLGLIQRTTSFLKSIKALFDGVEPIVAKIEAARALADPEVVVRDLATMLSVLSNLGTDVGAAA